MADTVKIAIDICVCTFRRDYVVETLQSVAKIEVAPEWQIRVIVADNDDVPSARDRVERTARETGLNVTYLHAPSCNISIARNACLDAATGDFIIFIDDDELVTTGWLRALMAREADQHADVIMGPVHSVYLPDAPSWMKKGQFHSTIPVWVDHVIVTGGCGNVMMHRASPAVAGQRFRVDLGKSGGEDTTFFAAIHRAGGIIQYAWHASATEIVPASRASLRWLLRRRFRYGQTHGTMVLETPGMNAAKQAKTLVLAALKAGFCYVMMVLTIARLHRSIFWLLRGTLHVGVISRLLGKRELEHYGQGN